MHVRGILDTSVIVDLRDVSPKLLPREAAITAVTLAELSDGPAAATNDRERATRVANLQDVEHRFDAIAFDDNCARRYGQLAALVRAGGRSPRPRRLDLMIAAIASVHELPLFTRNPRDFVGLEAMLTVVGV
jgi:predicted nucleic acid-binding protein